MDIKAFTKSVEVIDAHVHVQRSEAHAQELYNYFLMRGPFMTGPIVPPALGTLEQALAMRERTGVCHLNMLMFTWSGMYYRDGQFTFPDNPSDRAAADRELQARVARRVRDNNEWAVETARRTPGLSCFIGIDPVVMDEKTMLAEVEDKVRRGAKGVKSMFPDAGVLANDRRLWPLYGYLEKHEIPIQMVTAEWGPGLNRPVHCTEALAAFPKLRMIFSHIGHGREFGKGTDAEFLDLARKYEYVCGDVSLRLPEVADGQISPTDMVTHLRKIGTQRILYGSNFCLNELLHPDKTAATDFQMTQTVKGLEVLATLPLTEDERADIAGRNYRRWVGLNG
jgi:predicted TIM-barrel fold metal-dependent hydrolase